MKIKNLILTVLTGAIALLVSCTPVEPVINTLEGIELGSTYITIAKGQPSATTTMKIDESWTSEVPEWLTLDPSSGAAGDYTLKFIAKADTLDQGEVKINFGGKTQHILVIRDGEKAKPAGVIFEEPFVGHGQGDFEIKNLVGNPWGYDAKYGMKATAYIDNANTDADSYLISPEIDLAGEANAILTFEDAVNYMNGKAVTDYLSVEVTTDNGATWEVVTVPTWPAGSGWDYVESGDVDLTKYLGKKIKFAFHYKSNTAASPTWEIMNVKLSNVADTTPGLTCKVPEVTVGASQTTASFEIEAKHLVGGWSVSTSTDWITDYTKSGTESGTINVTFTANTGAERIGTLTVKAAGVEDVVLTIKQAEYTEVGTLEKPYTVAQAIEAIKAGSVAGDVYVKGIISNTTKYNYGEKYNTASFWMSDDGVFNDDLEKDFEAYGVFWLGGSIEEPVAGTDIKANFAIGDEVIIYGQLTKYEKNGTTTYETTNKKAKIYSLNWATSDENGVGNVNYPFNAAGAKKFIDDTQAAMAAAKEKGETLTIPDVAVAGVVSELVSGGFSAQYGNGTFWISDDGSAKDFEAYRVMYLENQAFTEGMTNVAVGDAVILKGQLTKYKETYETSQNKAYLYSLNGVTELPAAEGAITIDGNFDDWADIAGEETPDAICKVTSSPSWPYRSNPPPPGITSTS